MLASRASSREYEPSKSVAGIAECSFTEGLLSGGARSVDGPVRGPADGTSEVVEFVESPGYTCDRLNSVWCASVGKLDGRTNRLGLLLRSLTVCRDRVYSGIWRCCSLKLIVSLGEVRMETGQRSVMVMWRGLADLWEEVVGLVLDG